MYYTDNKIIINNLRCKSTHCSLGGLNEQARYSPIISYICLSLTFVLAKESLICWVSQALWGSHYSAGTINCRDKNRAGSTIVMMHVVLFDVLTINSIGRRRIVTKYTSRWLQVWACAMWANKLCMLLLSRVYASYQMSITRMKAEPVLITDQYRASFEPLATPMDTFVVVPWRKLKSGYRHVYRWWFPTIRVDTPGSTFCPDKCCKQRAACH